MKGISPKDTFDFICLEDRDKKKDEQSVFVCNYLTIDQEADLEDKLGVVTDDGYQVAIGSTALIALHYGLEEIKNLNVNGKPVKLERDRSKKKLKGGIHPWKLSCLSAIPKRARTEIAEAIREGGELSGEERKN
jgi:hypothetical protein